MLPQVRTAFSGVGVDDIFVTRSAGEERGLAMRAIRSGFTTIVAVGGDGTSSNIANAILSDGSDIRIGILPTGTGNDFAKTLGTARVGIQEIARLSKEYSGIRVDAGRIENTWFLNSCGFGFDVAVIERVARSRWLRGRAVYMAAALQSLMRYRGLEIEVAGSTARRHMMLVIANSPHFGGAFTIAPGASVVDGQLEAISILDVAVHRRIALLAAASRGAHCGFREVTTSTSASFKVGFTEPPSYQADGEIHHATSRALNISCSPHALRVLTGASGLATRARR